MILEFFFLSKAKYTCKIAAAEKETQEHKQERNNPPPENSKSPTTASKQAGNSMPSNSQKLVRTVFSS